MSKLTKSKKDLKENRFDKFLNKVENIGNKLPDPVTIFLILCCVVILASWITSIFNVSVVNPSNNETVKVVNLMNKEGWRKILMQSVTAFQEFPPLGMVLVVMLGAGVAEKSGFLTAAMKNSVCKVSPKLVTATVILISILADGAGDAGFIILPPLAATVFLSIGRHPLVGMFAAYAGVAGGFSANLIVNMTDVLMASFTIPAAKVIDSGYKGTPAMNIYFMLVSTIFLVIAGVFVTEKIISPRFEKYNGTVEIDMDTKLNEKEKKALKYSWISIFFMILVVILLCIGKNAFMADPKTGSILAWESPLMQGLIPLITIIFLIPGIIYGKIIGKIKNDKDVINMMGESMKDMGAYIVLAFIAALFIALFNWSNLGVIISVKGAQILEGAGLKGVGVIVCFVIFEAIINIFVGSASAKWAIMAPVFVPMFLLIGYDPAVTQMAFRIADSITNPISPLFPYFPILVAFARKYDKDAGMGTMISNMLPYSIVFGVLWIILLVGFISLNIPLGPNANIHYILK